MTDKQEVECREGLAGLLPHGPSAQNLTKLACMIKLQAFVWGKVLGTNIAALCERSAAVAQEQVLYVMRAVVWIDDGSSRIVAHATSAEQVYGKLLFFYG